MSKPVVRLGALFLGVSLTALCAGAPAWAADDRWTIKPQNDPPRGVFRSQSGTIKLAVVDLTAPVVVIDQPVTISGGQAIPDTSDVAVLNAAVLTVGSSETIGGLSGPGAVALAGSVLTVGANNASSQYAGAITGTGGLTKTGAGTLTLAGASSFTGPTTISQGRLLLTGRLAGPVTVQSGATLAGTGTAAGAVSLLPGGTIAPGASIGALTVGSLNATGGTLQIEFGGASTGLAADRLVSLGSVTVSGAAIDARPVSAASDYLFNQQYRILTSPGAIAGSFTNPASFSLNPYDSSLLQRLRYDSAGVVLEIRRLIDFTAGTVSAGQAAVAAALNTTEVDASDVWADLLNQLAGLSPDGRRRVLELLGGEGSANAAQSSAEGLQSFLGVVQARLRGIAARSGGRRSGGFALAMLDQPQTDASPAFGNGAFTGQPSRGFWAEGFGIYRKVEGSSGLADTRTDLSGLAIGLDTTVSRTLSLGLAAGLADLDSKTDQRLTRAEGAARYLAAYADYGAGPWFGTLSGAYARTSLDLRRTVGLTNQSALAKTKGEGYAVGASVAYRIPAGGGELQPNATAQYAHNRTKGYVEQGAGPLNLAVAPMKTDQVKATAGVRWLKSFFVPGDGIVTPELAAGVGVLGGDRGGLTGATFVGAPSSATGFEVRGVKTPRAWGYGAVGMIYTSRDGGLWMRLGYQGAFGKRMSEHQIGATVRFAF